MRFEVFVHFPANLAIQLDRIENKLSRIIDKENSLMATLDEVLADVTDESTRIDSLATLVAGIKKQLEDILAGQLPAAVQAKVDAVFSGIEANKGKVQAAIDANTTPA